MTRITTLISLAIIFAACHASDSEPSKVVARVNGAPVVLSDDQRAGAEGSSSRENRVDAAVLRHLAADEAARRGLATDGAAGPRSAKQEERLRDALFANIRDSVTLSDEELRAHYEKNKLGFTTRMLVLRRKPFPSEAAARDEDRRLGSGALGAGAEALGPAPVDQLPTSVVPEALTLTRVNQRIAVLRSGDWSLVELEEVRLGEPLPFEAVRPRIEQGLRLLRAQSAFHDELERLHREAKVEIEPGEGPPPGAQRR